MSQRLSSETNILQRECLFSMFSTCLHNYAENFEFLKMWVLRRPLHLTPCKIFHMKIYSFSCYASKLEWRYMDQVEIHNTTILCQPSLNKMDTMVNISSLAISNTTCACVYNVARVLLEDCLFYANDKTYT